MSNPINSALLESLGACSPQLERFVLAFGDHDAPLSVEVAVKHASDFDWDWAADNLLPIEKQHQYNRKADPLWAARRKEAMRLLDIYNSSTDDQKDGTALQAYCDALDPVRKTYNEATARLFAELYLTQ